MKKPRTRQFRTQAILAGVSLLCAIFTTFGMFAIFAMFAVSAVPSMSFAASPQAPDQPALQPPAPGDEGPLVADGAPADLAIVYTGGVVGYVEPCG